MMKTKTSFVKRGAVALLTLLFGLCLGLGLYYTVPKTAHAEGETQAIEIDGSANSAAEWNKAIEEASKLPQINLDDYMDEGSEMPPMVVVNLTSNWTADETNGFGTGVGFEGGALLVKGNVMLNLNGHTLDRNLTDGTASKTGWVIRVAEGSTLFVAGSESNDYGTLTGANGVDGGAIYAYSATSARPINIVLGNVTISGNKANVGAGLYLHANTKLIAHNLTVTNNTATTNGGGIYLTGNGNNRADALLEGKVVVEGNTLTEKTVGVKIETTTPDPTPSTPDTGDNTEGGTTTEGTEPTTPTTRATTVETKDVTVIPQSNICFGSSYSLAVGELTQGSEIYVSPNSTQTVIASGYKTNNKAESGIAVKPTTYFHIDTNEVKTALNSDEQKAYEAQYPATANGYIALDADGNVSRVPEAVKWAVAYTKDGAFTDVDEYGISFACGAQQVWGVKLNGNTVALPNGQAIQSVNRNEEGKIIPYTLTYGVANSGVMVSFDVFVTAYKLDASSTTVTLAKDSFEYTGSAITPEVTVTYGTATETTLVKDRDYTVSYDKNIAMGTATVTVTGIGNYEGTLKKNFEITQSTEKYKDIVWEFFADGAWTTTPNFTYDGTNQINNIRAKLAFGDVTEYVYVEGYEPEDQTNWNSKLKLTLDDSEFKVAKDYTVTLGDKENGNAVFDDGYKFNTEVTIAPKTVDFTSLNEEDINLWQVEFNQSYFSLLDGRNNRYMEGSVAKNCTAGLSYADWRDGSLTLVLNGGYVFDGVSLQAYLDAATGNNITYKHSTVNEKNEKTEVESVTVTKNAKPQQVETTVTFTLNDNFCKANGEKVTIEFTKTWYVATLANSFTTMGDEDVPAPTNWVYGSMVGVQLLKPRNGNTVVYTFMQGDSTVGKFATVVEGTTVSYYRVGLNGTVQTNAPINIDNYFNYFVERLGAGTYTMRAEIPSAQNVISASREFTFTVSAYSLEEGLESGAITLDYPETVPYNGKENNVPEVTVTFNGRVLEEGVDYELSSKDKDVKPNGGKAELVITGIGGLSGELVLKDAFEITCAQNSWIRVPSIARWTYMNFDKKVNVITAQPALLDTTFAMWFKVSTDAAGNDLVEGLDEIRLRSDGYVSDAVAEALAALPVGDYYLFAKVDGNQNYTPLEPEGIAFHVFTANNYWETAPSVNTWVKGSYDETENAVVAKAHFGTATIVITDEKGNVVYDPANEINLLASAGVGTYVLTATVAESANYTGMSFTSTFRVFAKAGWPWWVTLIVVLAVLLIIAIVLIILSKKGILQMLSGKAVVAIRAKASADATIAAVKANKAAEEAKAALALAEARERIEALRLASEEAKNRPAVEQVEDLEERAQDAAKQAARMQKKAARIQKQADMMKAQATVGVEMEGQIPVMPKTETESETQSDDNKTE